MLPYESVLARNLPAPLIALATLVALVSVRATPASCKVGRRGGHSFGLGISSIKCINMMIFCTWKWCGFQSPIPNSCKWRCPLPFPFHPGFLPLYQCWVRQTRCCELSITTRSNRLPSVPILTVRNGEVFFFILPGQKQYVFLYCIIIIYVLYVYIVKMRERERDRESGKFKILPRGGVNLKRFESILQGNVWNVFPMGKPWMMHGKGTTHISICYLLEGLEFIWINVYWYQLSHEKKPALLFIESWLFTEGILTMLSHNPHITV